MTWRSHSSFYVFARWKLLGFNSNGSMGVIVLASAYNAQPHLPSVFNSHVVSSLSLFVHQWASSEGPQVCVHREQSISGCSAHTPVVFSIWGSQNTWKVLVQVKWLLKICWHLKCETMHCLQPWRECTPCQRPGRTHQWCERMLKVCWFAHSLIKFFSVSVQKFDPWSKGHPNMRKAISANIPVKHTFLAPALIPGHSVFRTAWSDLNCLQLTMTFQQLGSIRACRRTNICFLFPGPKRGSCNASTFWVVCQEFSA